MQKNLVILGILVVIVFIAGCTGTTNVQANTSAQAGGNQPSGNQPAPSGGTPTPSGGGAAPPGGTVNLNECLASCNILTGNSLQATCQSGCYLGAATDTKDITKCDKLLTLEGGAGVYDICVTNVATQLNDFSMCAKAKTNTYQDMCVTVIAETKTDATICSSVKDEVAKDGCVSNVATKKKDASICAMIKLDYMKESCMSGANGQ
ncbi:hypothetical protein HY988_07335 [Candidatus Micrarchaeota archaeon]|nr:hypothetical protein [Candidatus Micrarchaeota archaeon]